MHSLMYRGLACLIVCNLYAVALCGAQQNYSSILSSTDVKIDPESDIEWGCADEDKIELYNIDDLNNGFIDFTISPTNDVEVTLVNIEDPAVYYGYKFNLTSFDLIVAGIVETFVPPNGVSSGYNQMTEFKVEKCGDKVLYYKDGVLVFSYCADNDGKIGALFHRTEVFSANNSQLDLLFESEALDCTSNIVLLTNNEALFKDGTTYHRTERIEDALYKTYAPNRYIRINIFTLKGRPIKQFRKRINSAGKIQSVKDVEAFLAKGNYQMNLKIED